MVLTPKSEPLSLNRNLGGLDSTCSLILARQFYIGTPRLSHENLGSLFIETLGSVPDFSQALGKAELIW